QVQEDLLERNGVRDEHRQLAADRNLESVRCVRELNRVLDERVTIGLAALADLASGARVGEQVVEQPGEAQRAPLEQLEILLHVVPVVALESLPNPLHEELDRAKRRFQVVRRDVRELL